MIYQIRSLCLVKSFRKSFPLKLLLNFDVLSCDLFYRDASTALSISLYFALRVWNYEEATLLNGFDNHDFPDKGISKLCLVNELDDSMLLVASCNIHNSCHQVFQILAS